MTAPRLTRARSLLAEWGLDALLVHQAANLTYLSGFTGSAGIALITTLEALLLVDFRYTEQAASEAPEFEVIKADRQFIETLTEVVRGRGLRRVGFESESVTVKQHHDYADRLAPAELVPVEGVDRLRWIKDADELARVEQAVAIADAAFANVRPLLRPGAVERDVAVELEFFMRRHGAEKAAFETIVASGPRSALPHGRASDRVLQPGEFVTLDFGAVYRSYVSDCARTVVLGSASAKHRQVYATVLAAQEAALAGVRPGMTGKAADGIARAIIAEAGYGEAFGHSLGHGVGLVVHEGPTLSPREEAVLAPGMVVTIEPGIYLPGWGGVRIEDLAVITDEGCRSLTRAPKDLLVP